MIKVPQLPEELVAGLDFSPAGILQAFLNQMQNPLSLMLTGVAAVAAMAAFVVPAILLKVQQAKDQKLAADSPSGQRFERNFSSFVVRLALLEAVSIIGFYQVFVLAGNPVLFIPFLLVGVGLHLTQFPKDIHLGFEESAF
jgi:mannitol-specific phosphotransferase system IIBC component